MPEKHVLYGGSNAERWLPCAGYANLSKQVPRKPAGQAALDGTAQHKCMEMMLEDETLEPEKFLGSVVMGVEITLAHVDALKVALDAYCEIVESFPEDAVIFSEKFVGLRGVDDAEIGGTMDSGIVAGDRGAIIDFKFGQVEKAATGEQNLFYAVCARKSIPQFGGVKQLTSYIIQPAFDPATDKITYTDAILDQFETTMRAAISASQAPNPAFTEGPHCGWCEGKLACPAKVQRLSTLTAPNHVLDLAEVGRLRLRLKEWEKWAEDADERIQHELEHGVAVPGWKLVAKRAIRQWTDEAAAILKFRNLKIPATSYMVSKLISPAQAEKLIPKKEVEKLANPVSSGNTIAPEGDKRPAVLAPAALGQALKRLT
jgi:hypothetical protein